MRRFALIHVQLMENFMPKLQPYNTNYPASSNNFAERPNDVEINTIILHATAISSTEKSLTVLTGRLADKLDELTKFLDTLINESEEEQMKKTKTFLQNLTHKPLKESLEELTTASEEEVSKMLTSMPAEFFKTLKSTLKTIGRVSAHYLISHELNETGECIVYRLVEEDKKAWHAGISHFHNRENLNQNSIGIEMVCYGKDIKENEKHFIEYDMLSEEQTIACIQLIKDIQTRHHIAKTHILGHFEIAPDRKSDPYPSDLFERLANENLGIWYDNHQVVTVQSFLNDSNTLPPITWLQQALADYGFKVEINGKDDQTDMKLSLCAFLRRFRPHDYPGFHSHSLFSVSIESISFEAVLQDPQVYAILNSVLCNSQLPRQSKDLMESVYEVQEQGSSPIFRFSP